MMSLNTWESAETPSPCEGVSPLPCTRSGMNKSFGRNNAGGKTLLWIKQCWEKCLGPNGVDKLVLDKIVLRVLDWAKRPVPDWVAFKLKGSINNYLFLYNIIGNDFNVVSMGVFLKMRILTCFTLLLRTFKGKLLGKSPSKGRYKFKTFSNTRRKEHRRQHWLINFRSTGHRKTGRGLEEKGYAKSVIGQGTVSGNKNKWY